MWQPLNPTETPSPANQTPQQLEANFRHHVGMLQCLGPSLQKKKGPSTAHSNPCVEPPTVVKLICICVYMTQRHGVVAEVPSWKPISFQLDGMR